MEDIKTESIPNRSTEQLFEIAASLPLRITELKTGRPGETSEYWGAVALKVAVANELDKRVRSK